MQSLTPPPVERSNERRWLLPLVAIAVLAVALVVAALAASTSSTGYGWMMGGEGGWGWMWAAGALMMAIPLIILGLLIMVLFLRPSSQPTVVSISPPLDPTTEVRARYARGEITQEQYRQILNDLQRS